MAYERPRVHRVSIQHVLAAEVSQQDDYRVFYLNGERIAQVDLLAVLVDKEEGVSSRMILDDGTGKIPAQLFSARESTTHIAVGTPVHVIGKIREQQDGRVILCDFVRLIRNPKEIELRKLQVKYLESITQNLSPAAPEPIRNTPPQTVMEQNFQSPRSKVLACIRALDQGSGADYDDVLTSCGKDGQALLQDLIERGDVFEIRPGRLKIIE